MLEFTARAVSAGVLFGLIFGAANAYLGLRVGLTVSTSIPIAVLTVALFRAMRLGSGTLLEANMSQTIGSASSSLAAGTIFTIPALFLWGLAPPFWQVATLSLLGGLLGTAAMIPLRRLLIVKSAGELPYPEGTACAQVLKAAGSAAAGGRTIFLGLAIGAVVKLLVGGAVLIPQELDLLLPVLPKALLALEVAPALLGVGYILGYRQSAVMVAGSLISAVVFAPLIALLGDGLTAPFFPEAVKPIRDMSPGQIWSRYVRYIGAGAVAAAGILAVVRALPAMYASLRAVLQGLRGEGVGATRERTDRDLPDWVLVALCLGVITTIVAVPGLLAGEMTFVPRLVASIGITVFGLAFVVVSSRIVGLIGVSSNPTSAMTIVTLLGVALTFAALGWNDVSARAAVLTVGTVVCVAASIAGDTSQDLKTGHLLGATPAWQQLGQLVGVATACWAIAATVLLLNDAYGFGTANLPAPQATLMRTVIDGVLSGALPWGLVGTGAGLSLGVMLAGVPGLSFAVGVYLPLATLAPIFVGGCVRRLADARRGGEAAESDPGILGASGWIAGEGLAGIAIAGVMALKKYAPEADLSRRLEALHFGEDGFAHVAGPIGVGLSVLLVLALCAWLYRAARSAGPASAAPAA